MSGAIERTQRLAQPRPQAFEFFADAFNLEAITPPWLHFRVLTDPPIEIGEGTLIDYRLRLHGVPVRWRTEIREWRPPERFRDVQIRGPYAVWDHTHSFEPNGAGGTVMRDLVRYEMPLGPLGQLAERLLVRRDLERIFDYRAAAIERLSPGARRGPRPAR
ncbi:MAG: SRPBCC family protein [Solirubrobacterales bacterium]